MNKEKIRRPTMIKDRMVKTTMQMRIVLPSGLTCMMYEEALRSVQADKRLVTSMYLYNIEEGRP